MQTQANQGVLDRFFKLREKNTTVKTEVLAGLTTFIFRAQKKLRLSGALA